jgi:hypothetical protein
MSFYLLDHPNPNGSHFYTSRRKPIRTIVIHTAEGLVDTTPPDLSAEAVAQYGATTPRSVSWHVTVDSDSIIPMLPDTYTAWHATNANSHSLGVEIAYRHNLWTTNLTYEEFLIQNTAQVVGSWCRLWDIPARRITVGDVANEVPGIISHKALDPTRRKDPGANFPWDRFLHLVAKYTEDDEMAAFVDSITASTWHAMGRLFPEDPNFGSYYSPGGGVEAEADPTAARTNAFNVWMQRSSSPASSHTHPLPAHTHPLPAHTHSYSGRTT